MQLVHRSTSGPLPTSTFTLRDHGEDVGFIQIRHRSSHGEGVPAQCASHIYYEIGSQWRRRGYGTKLLALGKDEARRLGLREILVSCLESNPASKTIIERNGGTLRGAWPTDDGEKMFSYRIGLTD